MTNIASHQPHRHTILMVDDDALVINTLSKLLASRQIQVNTASTPQEARQIMEKIVPCLLTLDLLLTKEDGSQSILDFMKSQEKLSNVPVVVLTNLDKPELKNLLLAQGVKEYIVKGTVSLDELHQKILSHLK